MKKETLLNAIREDRLYDLICNEGWSMSKDELILLAKECYYAATSSATQLTHNEYKTELLENLNDYWSD